MKEELKKLYIEYQDWCEECGLYAEKDDIFLFIKWLIK